ncbi:bifunctional oligoribonuclease/PAP phosphatase NrnA [Anaerolinea sp.]|uniref:DHH family phosphoesterase n=1 Tax=Anaerolinea sp. TaxID=1872519 RepID=UPI002ACD30A2|nr:bifunctional oligoribonuclease/PAP phosphatase NrnA [Anaerolinea sp.]
MNGLERYDSPAQALQHARRVRILTHVRPDGDAIGSMLGLGLSLQAAGKQVQMILPDGVPAPLRFLPGSSQIVHSAAEEADLLVVLDSSDLPRTGGLPENAQVDVNIDHHITNTRFARLNWVEPDAVATAAILAEQLPAWGFPLEKDAASALLAGIITDTIGFRTSNTTSKALRLAADLMDRGADLPELYRAALLLKSFEAVRFWGFGLERLQRKNGLFWTVLYQQDREATGYNGNDDADLINFLSSTECDIVVLFNEQKEGKVKVSWRSRPGIDVSALAVQFGGGGHPAAAGAEIPGTVEEVRQQVLAATEQLLRDAREMLKSNGQ